MMVGIGAPRRTAGNKEPCSPFSGGLRFSYDTCGAVVTASEVGMTMARAGHEVYVRDLWNRAEQTWAAPGVGH